jgi:large subunit ribosomal protein L4e
MFAPTKIWRRWHRKINITQKRYAVASALAASAVPALVMARGHRVDGVAEIPFVLDESFAKVDKTAQAVKVLGALGVGPELDKSKDSKKIRAGKGKMRNRRYVLRRGPLVIYSTGEEGVVKAVRNIVGVEAAHVDRLNLLQLAPGGHLGRFCIWTRGAFERLDAVFGTQTEKSQVKLDYVLPRAPMANADLARIINSEEVQSVVRPAVTETVRLPRKKNPLKNLAAMVRMNPYVLVHRRQELKRMAAAAGAKKGGKEKDEKKARKAAGRAFYEQASKEGDIKF